MFGSIGLPELVIILCIALIVVALGIVPFWMIYSKAGFSKWLALTQLIPLVNVIVLFYVAFAEWPIQGELRELRQRHP